jgi:hypothetical protein
MPTTEWLSAIGVGSVWAILSCLLLWFAANNISQNKQAWAATLKQNEQFVATIERLANNQSQTIPVVVQEHKT